MTPTLFVLALAACKKDDPLPEPVDPGYLALTSPQPADWLPLGTIHAKGEATNIHDLTVQGDATPIENGAFTKDIEPVRGLDVVEVTGVSTDGHDIFDRRGVLVGEFADPTGPIPDAAEIRINQGGLDALLAYAGTQLDPSVVSASLTAMNPIYEDSFVFGAATVSASVALLTYDTPVLTATPEAGVLELQVTLPNLYVDVPVSGDILGIPYDVNATMSADAVHIDTLLTLSAVDGALSIGVGDATVQLDGFAFDTSLIPTQIESVLLADTVAGVVEDQLTAQIETTLPALLDEQLAGLSLNTTTTILDVPLTIAATFSDASIDHAGIRLVTDMDVSVPPVSDRYYAGYLTANGGAASPDQVADLGMALSDDLMNRLLFEMWRGGMLDMTLSTEDGTLDAFLLTPLGATNSATVTLNPLLPPVITQGADGGLQLGMGELGVEILTPGGINGERLELAVSMTVPVTITIEDNELKMGLGAPVLSLMVRDSDWGVDPQTLTRSLEQQLPISVLLALIGDVSFPLPALPGISIGSASVTRDASGVDSDVAVDLL